jgi:ribosomal protein S12 methylthiotransferase accessory factor
MSTSEVLAGSSPEDPEITSRTASATIDSLISPFGIVSRVYPLPAPRGANRIHGHAAGIGSGYPGVADNSARHSVGSGRTFDNADLARLIAIAEGAERYAGRGLHDKPVLCTADELDGPVIDLDRAPRCTPREYAEPGCPVVPLDKSAPLRWIKGIDLRTRQETWIPAVMACYGMPKRSPPERFWYPISTGHAIHTAPAEALVRAICEVIERDANAILWLQRLPLPLVSPRRMTERCRYLIDWAKRHFIETYLFDSTTDLGVPTAYCLQIAEHDTLERQTVGAGTGRDIDAASEKALLEAITIRGALRAREPVPRNFKDFQAFDAARYMALPEQQHAFDFLTDGLATRPVSDRADRLPTAPAEMLADLARRLAESGMQAVAADRTTRELADAGLCEVVVVVPDLQPMSLDPLAGFRAHPRLYSAPERMGYPCLPEEDLNRWPQPLA